MKWDGMGWNGKDEVGIGEMGWRLGCVCDTRRYGLSMLVQGRALPNTKIAGREVTGDIRQGMTKDNGV
jgi:hypothetical protein